MVGGWIAFGDEAVGLALRSEEAFGVNGFGDRDETLELRAWVEEATVARAAAREGEGA